MDPQQRMLLETTWHALEDAAIDPDALRGSRTGVYAGIGTSEYRDLIMRQGASITYLGSAVSMALGRVSFQLGLEGPTMPVSLNCASSLVAIHHAVRGLGQGEVDLALAGGVSTVLSPGVTREMADLGLLSRNGRCSSFDAAADGFVRGEGCGVVVLKRLADAEADGDRVWGVIRGSAVNQNGAAAGPTVPNGPAQERVIETALERAGRGARRRRLPRGARRRLAAWRPDRGERRGRGLWPGTGSRPAARDRLGEDEHRSPRVGGRCGVPDQDRTGDAPRRHPEAPPFPGAEPAHRLGHAPGARWLRNRTPWPAHDERPHRAAVSAFGISGVNAHVVLEGHGDIDDGSSALPERPRRLQPRCRCPETDRGVLRAERFSSARRASSP